MCFCIFIHCHVATKFVLFGGFACENLVYLHRSKEGNPNIRNRRKNSFGTKRHGNALKKASLSCLNIKYFF